MNVAFWLRTPTFWSGEYISGTTVTLKFVVKDPNSPKTKPAIATAAIRVIVMRMIVLGTGLTPLRLVNETHSERDRLIIPDPSSGLWRSSYLSGE